MGEKGRETHGFQAFSTGSISPLVDLFARLLDLRQEAADVLEEDLRQLVDEHRCAHQPRRQLAVHAVALEPAPLVLQGVLHLTTSPFGPLSLLGNAHDSIFAVMLYTVNYIIKASRMFISYIIYTYHIHTSRL